MAEIVTIHRSHSSVVLDYQGFSAIVDLYRSKIDVKEGETQADRGTIYLPSLSSFTESRWRWFEDEKSCVKSSLILRRNIGLFELSVHITLTSGYIQLIFSGQGRDIKPDFSCYCEYALSKKDTSGFLVDGTKYELTEEVTTRAFDKSVDSNGLKIVCDDGMAFIIKPHGKMNKLSQVSMAVLANESCAIRVKFTSPAVVDLRDVQDKKRPLKKMNFGVLHFDFPTTSMGNLLALDEKPDVLDLRSSGPMTLGVQLHGPTLIWRNPVTNFLSYIKLLVNGVSPDSYWNFLDKGEIFEEGGNPGRLVELTHENEGGNKYVALLRFIYDGSISISVGVGSCKKHVFSFKFLIMLPSEDISGATGGKYEAFQPGKQYRLVRNPNLPQGYFWFGLGSQPGYALKIHTVGKISDRAAVSIANYEGKQVIVLQVKSRKTELAETSQQCAQWKVMFTVSKVDGAGEYVEKDSPVPTDVDAEVEDIVEDNGHEEMDDEEEDDHDDYCTNLNIGK